MLAGFGGVLVWARRSIVDRHRWMTADELNETFALGRGMNSDPNPILTMAWTFGPMSLFAVGGANAAIPEM